VGGLSSSISKITMKPRCGSASRICAITSNRFRRNERQGDWRQSSRTENGELALRYRRHRRLPLSAFVLLIGTVSTNCAFSQQFPADLQQPDFQTDVRNAQTAKQANTQCIEPAPLVSLQDYEGPMKKTVGFFARALERKAANPPRYKAGVFLCSLETKDKFVLFLQDSLNPVAFLSTGFNAGLDQASDRDHAFGQGTKGYAKRYGASFADQASSKFFKDFAFPSLFSEDPRYYRMARGRFGQRLLHAVGHSLVAYREDGTRIFNSSEWLGMTIASVLGNAYHPGNARGAGAVAQNVGFAVLQDMGFDVLREFWPEVSRKLNPPFRGSHEASSFPESSTNQ
jgi:hypothetical protein